MALSYLGAALLLILAQPAWQWFVPGAALVLAGVLLRLWAFGHLVKHDAITTTGPYAHTRNPAYLGSAMIMSGLFLAGGNADTSCGLVVWSLGVVGLVFFFGRYLPRKYDREYAGLAARCPQGSARHAAHVPHFFPRLTPWRSGDDRRFSWSQVAINNEWIWPLACGLALLLIALQGL